MTKRSGRNAPKVTRSAMILMDLTKDEVERVLQAIKNGMLDDYPITEIQIIDHGTSKKDTWAGRTRQGRKTPSEPER